MRHQPSLLLGIYQALKRTRVLEDQIYYLYHHQNPEKPLIIGKGYLSTGQEAISVASAFALQPQDWAAPSHRDMGLHLARGITFKEIFAQYFCRTTGLTRGRDSNVHFGSAERKIVGFISHMGAALPIANGLAWAAKYKKEDYAVVTMFGDGASSQGCVHEAMNYAAVFKLPVVFVCNFNRWAISTPVKDQMAIENLATRAAGYGFEGITIDGNEVLQVYETVKAALDKARSGGGPTLVECKTFRMGGHGTHDPSPYIPQQEKDYWKMRDPVLLLRKFLEEKQLWDEEKEQVLIAGIDQELHEAIRWAAEQPVPEARSVLEGVFT
ncbi:MAG: thiamine pyrophosphate-dependent dehydrogenase E1 component subunit alpha [Deltaproteobacteria bacterium]|nr:thiamine pyrophosphate-dependent dehydrogenase E1 component subunit alpha [Deltaproteobacteria bacterium]